MTDAMRELGHVVGKHYAKPSYEHVSLGRTLRAVAFLAPFALFALLMYRQAAGGAMRQVTAAVVGVIVALLWLVAVNGIRIAAQWERGVILRLGNFKAVRGPGLFYVIPIIEYVRFLDTRTLVMNIPH